MVESPEYRELVEEVTPPDQKVLVVEVTPPGHKKHPLLSVGEFGGIHFPFGD